MLLLMAGLGLRLRGVVTAVVASRPAARTDFIAAMITRIFRVCAFVRCLSLPKSLTRGNSYEGREQRTGSSRDNSNGWKN